MYDFEIWDFLSNRELGVDEEGSEYDTFQRNSDLIKNSDVILLVFDVNNLVSFRHCQNIAEQCKRSKKVIFVANKCDQTDIEIMESGKLLQDVHLSETHQMMRVSTKSTFGLKNLFFEIDNDYANDIIEPDTNRNHVESTASMLVLKSDEQESISLQLAYTAFRVDMRFKED